MSKRKLYTKEMVAKSKNKVLACSTPEHHLDTSLRDSDSVCDSDASSPVPFLCTQDGTDGETDVVWNFYTPKAETRHEKTTPVSRRTKKSVRVKLIEKAVPKRRTVKDSQKNTELFQELIELNQNLHEIIKKKSNSSNATPNPQSGSEEDIFNEFDCSPKAYKSNNHCLRKNVLSSKFVKQDSENGIESDDSMNECLLKASQVVEEQIVKYDHTVPKRPCLENLPTKNMKSLKRIDQDSMDSILSNIRLESPLLRKRNKHESPKLNNDSFDNLLGCLNDSALEKLTQIPLLDDSKKKTNKKDSNWVLQEFIVHGDSPKLIFGRHSSMPESPTIKDTNKPSTSGMAFGRYNSMPFNKSDEKISVTVDSSITCTPDEIKKKHQQAREKLLAKRLLPFTASQCPEANETQQKRITKKNTFQPKIASSNVKRSNHLDNLPMNIDVNSQKLINNQKTDTEDIKSLIEKKRRDAFF
ncbi:unnamed protein product, partial [Leptidea sinapis]